MEILKDIEYSQEEIPIRYDIKKFKPPFPWFGGKSAVADAIWARLGDVDFFIDPFFGSGAILFLRPTAPKGEIINDKNYFLANFFRAIQQDPDQVAHWADWPAIDIELSAREYWLMQQEEFKKKMLFDPDYFDAKIAGWWAWGTSTSFGPTFCKLSEQSKHFLRKKRPILDFKKPGVQRFGTIKNLKEYFRFLRDRLRRTTICCGDWKQVLAPAKHDSLGIFGIFLDPPYRRGKRIRQSLYPEHPKNLADDVLKWARDNEKRSNLRIALCGYADDYGILEGWEKFSWQAHGGFSNYRKNGKNLNRFFETIWFSPACQKADQMELFKK
jgi:DNA adenine methylase